jgi:dihydroorotase
VAVINYADVENSFSYRFNFMDMFTLFQAGGLDNLDAFTSFNGPDFYGLPRNTSKIVLRKSGWKVPATQFRGDWAYVCWQHP